MINWEMFGSDIDLCTIEEAYKEDNLYEETLIESEFQIAINEGLFGKPLPKDIKDLKFKIKDIINEYNEKNRLGFKEGIKRSLTTASDLGVKVAHDVCKKANIQVYRFYTSTSTDGYGNVYYTHVVFGKYKDYVLQLSFSPSKFDSASLNGIRICYDPEACQIPKGLVFDVMGVISNQVNNVVSKDKFIKFSFSSTKAEQVYKKLEKHSDKFDIKKGMGSVKVSVKKESKKK